MARMPGRRRFRVAAAQMTSTDEVGRNLRIARRLVREAAESGADLVALPENFAYLRDEGRPHALRESLDGPLVSEFRALARELKVHLLLGSFPEAIPGSPRVHNTSVLIDARGRRIAVYRKMHLFDIDVRGKARLRESRSVVPGQTPVVARCSLGRFGLSICYDLRFPELYRRLAFAGATTLFVPAAFTAYTGPFHWMALLRARAIENQCWVVAPAQVGRHSATRRSHGETAIIDPWGEVVTRKRRGTGLVLADIDRTITERVRRGLPSLTHARAELLGHRNVGRSRVL